MQMFPHRYTVAAAGSASSDVALRAAQLPTLRSAPPVEFDGPGNRWSPETLLVAAVADCFVLTFKSIAARSKLPWTSIDCHVTGMLDRANQVTRFTTFDIYAHLTIPGDSDRAQASRVLEKAEQACLITNSLNGEARLSFDIDVALDREPIGA